MRSSEEKVKKSIAMSIAEGYTKFSDSFDLLHQTLPDKLEIIKIINMLRELIFPGYYGNKSISGGGLLSYIDDLLRGIRNLLAEQIIEDDSLSICESFVNSIPVIQEYISYDIQAAYDGDPAVRDKSEIILSYPGIYAIFIYRFAHELHSLGVSYIPRIMTEYAHEKTGIDIHPGAVIGKYFFIDHGTGIVIGETTVIGDHVKIYQGVTLGALSTKGGQNLKGVKRHPTIEDNVTIYSGASVLGGQTIIGKDTVLGGNVFITKSVPAGTKLSISVIQ